MAIFDLKNRIIKEGNTVVLGKDWAKDCDFLVIGIVKEIQEKPTFTQAIIEITHNGHWNYGKDTINTSKFMKTIIYKTQGREHNNILILNE